MTLTSLKIQKEIKYLFNSLPFAGMSLIEYNDRDLSVSLVFVENDDGGVRSRNFWGVSR